MRYELSVAAQPPATAAASGGGAEAKYHVLRCTVLYLWTVGGKLFPPVYLRDLSLNPRRI
jgi:hypothetical protein